MKEHIIVGHLGQVGSALMRILDADGHDRNEPHVPKHNYKFMHVCFGFNGTHTFETAVREYQKFFQPEITVIHSTVPVGTCDELGAVHSPIRGIHPDLEQGIRTFVKYFGGYDAVNASIPFARLGIETYWTASARDTEAMKLLDTTYYFWNIHFMRSVKRYCKERDLDFDLVYRMANETYNEGYTKLGHPEFVRPVLEYKEGKTGGHCLVPNAKLLRNDIAKFLLEEEEKL